MSELDSWVRNSEVYDYLTTKNGKPLKDYLLDKLPLQEAVFELVKHHELQLKFDESLQNVTDILSLIAMDLSDSYKQRKIVKFLVALRNLRYKMEKGFHSKRETNLRQEPNLAYLLSELNVSIEEGTNYLEGKILAPVIGLVLIKPESNIQFINFHAFMARLTSVNTCSVGYMVVGERCDAIINDDEVQSNRVIFNVAVSAAAQHMIYSALQILKYHLEDPVHYYGFKGWQEWKMGYEGAQTNPLIAASAKKDAKIAVAAMNQAELIWKQRQMPYEIDKHFQSYIKEIETRQRLVHGTKRSHDEAFLDCLI